MHLSIVAICLSYNSSQCRLVHICRYFFWLVWDGYLLPYFSLQPYFIFQGNFYIHILFVYFIYSGHFMGPQLEFVILNLQRCFRLGCIWEACFGLAINCTGKVCFGLDVWCTGKGCIECIGKARFGLAVGCTRKACFGIAVHCTDTKG